MVALTAKSTPKKSEPFLSLSLFTEWHEGRGFGQQSDKV